MSPPSPAPGLGQPVDGLEHLAVLAHRAALHQGADGVQAAAGVAPAVDLAHAGVPGAVGEQDQIAGEAGGVGPGQGHEHTVIPGHRDDLHFGNDGTVHGFSSF